MAVTKPNTSFLSKMPYPDTALSSLTPSLLLLLTLLLSIPKLAMAWRITKVNTQIGLFNNIVCFGLVTSGKNVINKHKCPLKIIQSRTYAPCT